MAYDSDSSDDENIKFLIRVSDVPDRKFEMYHSKFSEKVREEMKKSKSCHRTMGYAEVPLQSPRRFLKKKTRMVHRPFVDKGEVKKEPKPTLPPRFSKKTDKTEDKNFRKENILKVVRAVPKQPVHRIADTKDGHKQTLEPSGLQPVYIFRKGFGKTPKYIKDRLKVIEEKEKEVQETEKRKKAPLRYVMQDERIKMISGLKKNWEELQKEFQLLPMVTDTVPKIKRKTNLEKRLKALEKDIDLIERNPLIYVSTEQYEE